MEKFDITAKSAIVMHQHLLEIAKKRRELDWAKDYGTSSKLEELLQVEAQTIISLAYEIFGEDIAWTLKCDYTKAVHA